MRVILPEIKKDPLPKGKLSIRWVYSRNVYQVYIGGRYLYGASGATEEEALEMMRGSYEC